MVKSDRILIQTYLVWTIVELSLQLVKDMYPVMHGIFKGGLMPILMLMVATSPSFNRLGVRLLLLGSLLFAWAGDVLLLYDVDEDYFKAGLASFFLAQALYVAVFSMHIKPNEKRSLLRRHPSVILVSAFIFVVIVRQFYADLGSLYWPVIAYSGILFLMLMAALNRSRRTNEVSFWLVLIGAVLFVLSDALIAFDRFDAPIHGFYIMSTYTLAQGLIVLGLVMHRSKALNTDEA
jgi:uncharacterized membrane protein YhhN